MSSSQSPSAPVLPDPSEPAADELLERIDRRVLWLAARMIHEANVVRPSPDGLKVGGHQASSASSVTILTELLLRYLRRGDVLAPKPHAGPVFHAIQYLMGSLPRRVPARSCAARAASSRTCRAPRTRTRSTSRWARWAWARSRRCSRPPRTATCAPTSSGRGRIPDAASWPWWATRSSTRATSGRRIEEETLRGLGGVTWIVDLNRQSLDRVIPGIRVNRTEAAFAAAGWQVLEAKYGRHLRERFARPGGEVLRKRIDEMSNEEYQALLRIPGAEARERLVGGAAADDRDGARAHRWATWTTPALPALLADLGGHDHSELARLLAMGDAEPDRPTVDLRLHHQGLAAAVRGRRAQPLGAHERRDQVAALAPQLGADRDDPWAALRRRRPRRLAGRAGAVELYGEGTPERSAARGLAPAPGDPCATCAWRRASRPRSSTQMAFGDVLTEASAAPRRSRARLVTTSADVAVSTNLGGWINKVGVYDRHTSADLRRDAAAAAVAPQPERASTSSWASAR